MRVCLLCVCGGCAYVGICVRVNIFTHICVCPGTTEIHSLMLIFFLL